MKNFITLLERYLFDIIGVIVPGLTSAILYLLLVKDNTPTELIEQFQEMEYNTITWGVIIIFFYILGMFIKVIAIKTYKMLGDAIGKAEGYTLPRIFMVLSNFFNDITKKIFNITLKGKDTWWKSLVNTFILYPLKMIVKLFTGVLYRMFRILEYATTFKINKCPSTYKELYIEFRKEVNNQGVGHFDESKDIEEDAHLLYKLSSVIIRQNELKALCDNFLAKYNLFRSLALVFGIAGFYSIFGQGDYKITICLLTTWFVFHYKYIRYWGLCGGDAISTALIYLKAHKQQ